MTNSAQHRRFVAAGLAAPIAGGIWSGLFLATAMAVDSDTYQWPPTFVFMVALTAAYSAIIALLATWTLGLIWHALACARGWHDWRAYLAFGAGCGAVIATFIYLLSNSTWTVANWAGLLWFSSTGGIIALTGWLIRRPDRDAAANPPTSPP